jgi:hypothetical protein
MRQYSLDEFINSVHFLTEMHKKSYMQRCEERNWKPSIIFDTFIKYNENIELWLNKICTGHWNYRHYGIYEFENNQDALMFKMTYC